MKKPCYLVLILCVCCLPLLGQAISQSEAIDKGYSIIANQAGLSREDLRFGQAMHHKSDGSWTLSFFRKQRQWENDGVYRVEIASNGNLKELALPGEVRLSAHMSVDYWEVIGQEYGFYNQNLLALRAAWGEHLQAMIAQEEASRKPVEENFLLQFARALRFNYRQPDPNALPEQVARQLAEAAIIATPPWSQEKLAYYQPYLSVHYDSPEWGRPVWHFIYTQKSHSWTPGWADMAWDTYNRTYLKPLDVLFGNAFGNTPYEVSVRLDAGSGEVLGPVRTVYVGELISILTEVR